LKQCERQATAIVFEENPQGLLGQLGLLGSWGNWERKPLYVGLMYTDCNTDTS
jgi:hypothetical protein